VMVKVTVVLIGGVELSTDLVMEISAVQSGSCVTAKVFPAMSTVPVLEPPEFEETVMVTVSFPVPLVLDRVTQERLSEALHVQSEREALTVTS
jgi:hypothetical protein